MKRTKLAVLSYSMKAKSVLWSIYVVMIGFDSTFV